MLEVTLYTDPACPFAFSAEPVRQQLKWHYGDQLTWRLRMIVLTREPGEDAKLAAGAPGLQKTYGMPIDPAPHERPASSEPACRAVVAARLHAPHAEHALLRSLRVHLMAGHGLLDDPELIAAAARDAFLDPDALATWAAGDDVSAALEEDVAAARNPTPGARALDHKLGGPDGERRYSAPSYEIGRADGSGTTIAVPGFNPINAHDVAIAALDPDISRRPAPASVDEVLAWATEPLATVEVITLTGGEEPEVRAALARAATFTPAGADGYWTVS